MAFDCKPFEERKWFELKTEADYSCLSETKYFNIYMTFCCCSHTDWVQWDETGKQLLPAIHCFQQYKSIFGSHKHSTCLMSIYLNMQTILWKVVVVEEYGNTFSVSLLLLHLKSFVLYMTPCTPVDLVIFTCISCHLLWSVIVSKLSFICLNCSFCPHTLVTLSSFKIL